MEATWFWQRTMEHLQDERRALLHRLGLLEKRIEEHEARKPSGEPSRTAEGNEFQKSQNSI